MTVLEFTEILRILLQDNDFIVDTTGDGELEVETEEGDTFLISVMEGFA